MEPGFLVYFLGETDAANIVDAESADPTLTTTTAAAAAAATFRQQTTDVLNKADKFENRASRMPAPGIAPAHLRPAGTVSEVVAGWSRDIPGVRRCQEWTGELIDDLVGQGLLPESALAVKAGRRVPAD